MTRCCMCFRTASRFLADAELAASQPTLLDLLTDTREVVTEAAL